MRTLYILVVYPGMNQKCFIMMGTVYQTDRSFFKIVDDAGEEYYFPTALTIITTKPNILWTLPDKKNSED